MDSLKVYGNRKKEVERLTDTAKIFLKDIVI